MARARGFHHRRGDGHRPGHGAGLRRRGHAPGAELSQRGRSRADRAVVRRKGLRSAVVLQAGRDRPGWLCANRQRRGRTLRGGARAGEQCRCLGVRADGRSQLRRLRLDHGRELRRRGERVAELPAAYQAKRRAAARGERGQHGRLPPRSAGGHLHRQQVRGARADGFAALQPGPARHRLLAVLPGAHPYQRLGQRAQAARAILRRRFRTAEGR